MAGIATHLVIAARILDLLPEGIIEDAGLFYAGSIAPDAIHAREGFARAEKKHIHLRSDIPDKDFEQKANRDLFNRRVANFILTFRDRKDGLLDFYRGYVAHLLTDELYLLTLRKEFVQSMKTIGIDQDNIEFYHRIVPDMLRNDFLLLNKYGKAEEIRRHLENVKSCEMPGYLSKEELKNSRSWVIQYYFDEPHVLEEPVHIRFERTKEFVEMAAADIILRLSEGGSLPRML